MRVTENMLKVRKRNEPKPEDLVERVKAVKKHFLSLGRTETKLAYDVLPLIARREADLSKACDGFDPAPQGVAILGNVGTGKTLLLQYASHVFDVEYFSVPELAVLYAMKGEVGFWERLENNHSTDLILDDLGAEAQTKSFGNHLPIHDLLYRRYNAWQQAGHRLWLASNLTVKELEERYGVRILDRIREMCHVVPAVGESLRKQERKNAQYQPPR